MKRLVSFVSLMVILVFLSGCAAAAPSVQAAPVNNPSISSSQLGFRSGSGENLAPPAEVYFYAPGAAYFGLGSGENVSRPAEALAVMHSAVSNSGENVVPPPGTMAYLALHLSNP